MQLEGWGRYPRHDSEVVRPTRTEDIVSLLQGRQGIIARGNGRAYGDAAMGERATLVTRGLDRMKSFNPATGQLTVEAGVLLSDIIDAFVPRGFFPPVVPGTRLVTVGGMIAADIHGKNHHRDGGFGAHLLDIKLVLPGGEMVTCSPNEKPELFHATIGGMGLTGIIAEATFTLRPIETAWIAQQTIVAPDLDGALKALDEADKATYSVAWIDCLARGAAMGRSLIYVGEHASRGEVATLDPRRQAFPKGKPPRLSVPLELPAWTLNRASVAAFNELYFRRGAAKQKGLVHWGPYFFPLDGVDRWNRIYGRRGFLQHQCVIPTANARAALGEILERFASSGKASFLAVLKKLGRGNSPLSFPLEGYTLALDVKVSDDVFPLLETVDKIVVAAGGRLYLAKDARQSRDTLEAGYPRLDEFRSVRRAIGAEGYLVSRLSERLGL